MNGTAAPSESTQPNGVSARLILIIGVVTGLLVTCLTAPVVAENLLLGWLYFPRRIFPQVTVDSPTLLLAVVSGILYVAVLHATLCWWRAHAGREKGDAAIRWRFRATLIVGAGVVLLFAAGTAMVAATHQTVWLISDGNRRNRPLPGVPSGLAAALHADHDRWRFRNGMRETGTAALNVHDVYRAFPYGGTMDEDGRLLHGWATALLPYLLYTQEGIDFSKPWNEPPNDRLFQCALPQFLNPAVPEVFDDEGYGLSHVAGNLRVLPIVAVARGESGHPGRDPNEADAAADAGLPRPVSIDQISDGASHTLLIGEVAQQFKPWAHPANVRDPAAGLNSAPEGFGSGAGSGVLFLMADGSVRTIDAGVDVKVVRALATPAGVEDVPVD